MTATADRLRPESVVRAVRAVRAVTVRSSRCGTDVLLVGTLDAEASVPEEIASPCTHRIGNQSGRSDAAALVRGLSRFSLLRPRNAFDSTARGARSPA